MPLTDEDRERIEAFRSYIEDYLGTDDRYGPAERHDREPTFASRFEVAPRCWFEVAVLAESASQARQPRIRVAFLTSEQSAKEIIEETIAESGGGAEQYVAAAIAEAGFDFPDLTLDTTPQGGLVCYATELPLDELRDLDNDAPRNNTLRILEGFMLAFAPALAVEEEAD